MISDTACIQSPATYFFKSYVKEREWRWNMGLLITSFPELFLLEIY